MLTEEEAGMRWCPFVRHSADGQYTFNRGDTDPLNLAPASVENHDAWLCNCIASKCMAWRWEPEQTIVHITGEHPNWERREEKIAAKTLGHCGLAGKP
jgi:hypothetical protein